MRFQHTHNQGCGTLVFLFVGCSILLRDHVGDASGVPGLSLRVHQPAGNSKIVASVVPEVTHEASREPLKAAVSAQKALRGSETETRELLGGTEEKSG